RRRVGPQISFDRPELSPCLASIKKDEKKYSEALEIIRAGKRRLKRTPRADMDGFKPSPEHLKRLRKYMKSRDIEKANKESIRTGGKCYDRE
ncbi:MAG: hypothetical protein MI784_16010, partial [Cytophagales bacterium]|nr:hypothetical protein [Cytophagales bacterium]